MILLSRPNFKVLGWHEERIEPSDARNYQTLTGHVSFVSVFQEHAEHKFAALLLPSEGLLRLSIDGENIWQKPFESVSQAARSTTSPEDYNIARDRFSAQFETGSRRAATKPGGDAFGRIWTDRTGRYILQAKLLGKSATGLLLFEKQDGSTLHIAESELCADDREWIQTNDERLPTSGQ
jgi:hypothetical protein